MKNYLILLLFLALEITSLAQNHILISTSSDTLRGKIEQTNKEYLVFVTDANEVKNIPFTALSLVIKNEKKYSVVNGVLARFPIIENEKAGLTEIVDITGISGSKLFNTANEFVNSNLREFNRQADGSAATFTLALLGLNDQASEGIDAKYKNELPVKYSDVNSQKIVVRVVNRYDAGAFGCVQLVWWEYDLILKFKNDKFRIDLTNYRYDQYHRGSNIKMQFSGLKDEGNCGSSGNIEDLLLCGNCDLGISDMFSVLISDGEQLMKVIKDGVVKQVNQTDDW